ncbi:MAG: DNA-protecting protein DprA [Clostridia bacterium]|nr:DNA-protecting protein DprA [Clostridia bacterium]
MNMNSEAIKTFCSHLCVGEGVTPLEPKEWSDLTEVLMKLKIQPADLLNYSAGDFSANLGVSEEYAARLARLVDRSASLSFKLGEYENMGINVVTRADAEYPLMLKKKLGNGCPPMFYYAGDISLLGEQCVGFVGSRTVNDNDFAFTQKMVKAVAEQGYSVVSGGAKGVDSISESAAFANECPVVEYLCDSLGKRLRNGATVRAVQDGKLLLLSVVKPDAGFNAGVAMMRNRYIYAHSQGTVVIKSDLEKGGTWNGATDALKHGWCTVLCWNNAKYAGNLALIKQGAIPIDESFSGEIPELQKTEKTGQISLFDDTDK